MGIMKLKELRKNLPRSWRATREGKHVQIQTDANGQSVHFRVDRNAGWEAADLATYLASLIPPAPPKS